MMEINDNSLENSRENLARLPVQIDPPVRFELFLILVKVLIAVLFMVPLAHYSMKSEDNVTNNENLINDSSNIPEDENLRAKPRIEFIPPSSIAELKPTILREICEDYVFKLSKCTSEDVNDLEKHKIPVNSAYFHHKTSLVNNKNNNSDPRTNLISFLTGGFLIVSLIAAFMELYRAKKQTPAKNNKAPLTRKCSLADLTVLKHHRKEMIRRDSILEGNEQPDFPIKKNKAPPLQRSSSTPVDPGNMFNRSFDVSRRNSMVVVDNQQLPNYSSDNLNGRRSSSIMMDRKLSIIPNINDVNNGSPERKHHSRLVHRH